MGVVKAVYIQVGPEFEIVTGMEGPIEIAESVEPAAASAMESPNEMEVDAAPQASIEAILVNAGSLVDSEEEAAKGSGCAAHIAGLLRKSDSCADDARLLGSAEAREYRRVVSIADRPVVDTAGPVKSMALAERTRAGEDSAEDRDAMMTDSTAEGLDVSLSASGVDSS